MYLWGSDSVILTECYFYFQVLSGWPVTAFLVSVKMIDILHLPLAWLWHCLLTGDTEVLPGDRAGPPGLWRASALWPSALLHLRKLHTLSRGWCLLYPPLLIQVSSNFSQQILPWAPIFFFSHLHSYPSHLVLTMGLDLGLKLNCEIKQKNLGIGIHDHSSPKLKSGIDSNVATPHASADV